MKNPEIPRVEASIPENAISVYGQQENALDDFPVLKAFQQYIDSEQAKSRKRMLTLGIFFGVLMFVVIAFFVILLMNITARNQALNDRLFEYAMNNSRQQSNAPVVVQQPQDSSALMVMTEKLDALQNRMLKISEDQKKAAAEEVQAAKDAAKPKKPTAAELEVKRLTALLEAERERNSAERERQHQAEIEAYRRKYYPELYEDTASPRKHPVETPKQANDAKDDDLDLDLAKILESLQDDDEPLHYFDEEEVGSPRTNEKDSKKPEEPKKEYSIPVDVKGSSMRWNIPND